MLSFLSRISAATSLLIFSANPSLKESDTPKLGRIRLDHTATPSYRPEIDGLRAIAVLLVIATHSGIIGVRGGFIGVDVFFVISGFLITQIIQKELLNGNFSLWRFYQRRARRILPALMVVLLISTLISWHIILPDGLQSYGQSVFATLLMSNNLLLSLTTGYWDITAEFKPLLHTWSLGVEEQFYLVFPILMIALTFIKVSKKFKFFIIFLLALMSLVWAQYVSGEPKNAHYYLPHLRAWEILAGCICALLFDKVKPNEFLALAGIILISGSAVFLDASYPMPSVWLLPAIIGSSFVLLFAQKDKGIGRLLALPPIVLIGLASYSLYLWHQPVYTFARIASLEPPNAVTMIILTAVIFILSFLTLAFVEAPFRRVRIPAANAPNILLASSACFLIIWGLTAHHTKGFPGRMYDGDAYAANSDYKSYNMEPYSLTADSFTSSGVGRIIIAGDSQARDFINMGRESGAFRDNEVIYRNDIHGCFSRTNTSNNALIESADLLIIADLRFDYECILEDTAMLHAVNTNLLVVGPKDFGYNLNPYIHIDPQVRSMVAATVRPGTIEAAERIRRAVGEGRYIDVLGLVSPESYGKLPVFDTYGDLISADAIHLTRAGARVFGPRVFSDPRLGGL